MKSSVDDTAGRKSNTFGKQFACARRPVHIVIENRQFDDRTQQLHGKNRVGW